MPWITVNSEPPKPTTFEELGYVQVVRCKDCVNCVKEQNGELYCDILAVGYEPLGSKKVNEAWFCADGERRRYDD